MVNLWPGVNRPPVVRGGRFCQAWAQFSEVARYLPCPFIPGPLSPYPYFLFVISASTVVPLISGIKLLTSSNGEQCCPLADCAGSICTLLYKCNLTIFKCELLLGSGIKLLFLLWTGRVLRVYFPTNIPRQCKEVHRRISERGRNPCPVVRKRQSVSVANAKHDCTGRSKMLNWGIACYNGLFLSGKPCHALVAPDHISVGIQSPPPLQ